MSNRPQSARPISSGIGLLVVVVLSAALATPALGAQLLGGHRQTAIERAFAAQPSHRGQTTVSIRASTVSPAWAVLKSVRPERAGRRTAGARTIRLTSTYFHLVGGAERTGTPPKATKADLDRDFKIAVLYTGSGSETINYQQTYRGVCAGAGGDVDQETASVSPMSWSVRYLVDLDNLVSAVQSSQGTTLLPSVTFDAPGSSLSASEQITRTSVDNSCAGKPTTYSCVERFVLPGSGLGGIFNAQAGTGLEVGVPGSAPGAKQCSPENFILGPSLWDAGATTALAPQLGLVGGGLPANPYAPVSVSWPTGSAGFATGFVASACQDIATGCSDSLSWRGKVRLEPVTSG
jgi:hypothetical protein